MARKTTARKDPQPRPVNSVTPHFDLINQNPECEYKWVYKAAPEMGVDYYRDVLGYLPVQYTKDGVRPLVMRADMQDGEYITSQGHLLMFCPKEEARRIEEEGIGGGGGQKEADRIERRIFNSPKSIADLNKRIALRSEEGADYFELQAEKGSAVPMELKDI